MTIIPAGQVIDAPVTSLDVAATTTAAASIQRPANFDGLNLPPMLVKNHPMPDRALYQRFWRQSAIRKGDWKLLKFSDRATREKAKADHQKALEKYKAQLAQSPTCSIKTVCPQRPSAHLDFAECLPLPTFRGILATHAPGLTRPECA